MSLLPKIDLAFSDANDRTVFVIAGVQRGVHFADPGARSWLRHFFGRPPQRGLLPLRVRRWLQKNPEVREKKALVARRGKIRLSLREVGRSASSICLSLELSRAEHAPARRRHGTLTPRENEVMEWLDAGKSYEDIARILHIAPSTVGKHVSHILEKLGAENRLVAVIYYRADTAAARRIQSPNT